LEETALSSLAIKAIERLSTRKKRGEETGEKASVPSFALVFRAQIHRLKKRTDRYRGELDIEI